ncbi:type I restriction-modification system subunit M [Streptomyces sp. NPDC056987]|uniref:class I SAM-dependent DNA methyltransferase n=1 Tax=Streptomyces sp. NPDC056987 TaxID=3345988 RepID=UPI00363D59C8
MPPRQKKQAKPEDMKSILWKSADKLRGSLDAAEYKHFVLGLVFLKYVSDAMEEKRELLEEELRSGGMLAGMGLEGTAPEELIRKTVEDPLQYTGAGIFYVPPTARWNEVLKHAKVSADGPSVGEVIDGAMGTIEKFNRPLKDTLPRMYNSGRVDEPTLAELVRLLDQLTFQSQISLDGKRVGARDLMGEVYEYFLAQFALAEGRKGGEYFTPPSVVRLLVEMLEPKERERVLDPACGSGGMFVQAEKFVETHGGNRFNVSVYGQERNQTTWRLAKMNLAIHGIEVDLGEEPADSFRNDQHGDVKANVVLANPPFNISDWGGELLASDERWKYGTPPASNANFAWIQHMVSKLAVGGRAGIVLANGSMNSKSGGEGDIRRAMVEDDLVACMVALPGQLFRSTQIPACLWFLADGKGKRPSRSPWVSAERAGQVLFIDARDFGYMATRTMRELSDAELGRIAETFRSWRGVENETAYADIAGFCRSVPMDELREHDFVLTPGRYVGTTEVTDDTNAEPVEAKVARLTILLREQFMESERLAKVVNDQLRRIDA